MDGSPITISSVGVASAIPTLTDGKNELFSWGFLSAAVVVGVNYGPF
jgi:hypothetical protein